MATATELNQIYLAYFGRPADPGGLAYYANQPLAQVVQAFSDSAESQALYGTSFGTAAVNAMYQNLFNRDASAAEAQAWVQAINAPGGPGPAAAALTILQNAANDDLVTVTHKQQVAATFTAALDTPEKVAGYQGNAAAKAANKFMQMVDSSPDSVEVVSLFIEAQVAAVVSIGNRTASPAPAPPGPLPPANPAPAPPPPPAPAPPSSIALTTGADTLAGTAGDDTFFADTLQDANHQWRNALGDNDVLDGGAGNDTLEVNLGVSEAVQPRLRNIENVVLHARAAGGSALYLGSATGVTHATISGSSDTGFILNAGALAGVAVRGQTATAGFSGITSTTLGVALSAVGTAGNLTGVDLGVLAPSAATTLYITAEDAYVDLSDCGTSVATTLHVAATGTNVLNLNNGASTATSLSVTGTGSVDFTGVDLTALTTLSAALAGGAIRIHLGSQATAVATGAGKDVVGFYDGPAASAVVDLGAGDDVLSLGAAPAAGATLSGGAGNDTLEMDSGTYAAMAAMAPGDRAKISGFETLTISDRIGGGTVIDLAKFGGFGSFTAAGGVNNAVSPTAVTIDNLASGGTLTLAGDLNQANSNANGQVVVHVKNAAGGSADVLNLRLAPDVHSISTYLEAQDVETINVHVQTPDGTLWLSNTLFVTDDALKTITITGDDYLTLMAGATHLNQLTLVDASANTAGISTSLAVAATGVTVRGTASYDMIGLGSRTTATGNGGSDAYLVGTASSGVNYATVTDLRTGDRLWFNGSNDSFNSTRLALANGASFQDYLDAAAAGNGAGHGIVRWFQYGGDTYVVEDVSAGAAFVNGADVVVRLTGQLDLSHSTVDNGNRFIY